MSSSISQFYSNKVVLITGATGFMGKVLVEKLLRSTDVRKIYLLIRPKKGVEPKDRLKEALSSKVFDRVRKERSDSFDKVDIVSGDITEDKLGLSSESENLLSSEVNIIFHSAATINFDEEINKAIAMNVTGVLSLIHLAKKMENLEAFVDISTAYANCDKKVIVEKVYPLKANYKELIGKSISMEDDPNFLEGRPNTYTFTKSLAEKVLEVEGKDLPISVMRPSIVTASFKEPVPGWVDNYNGPSGTLAGVGMGILRTQQGANECVVDIVPVDMAINLVCTLGWWTATRMNKSDPPFICNFTSGTVNPLTHRQIVKLTLESLKRTPYEGMLWYPDFNFYENRYINRMFELVYHYGPFTFGDMVMKLLGQKPYLLKISNRLQKTSNVLAPFLSNAWVWSRENVDTLEKEMSDQDKEEFGFNLRVINWKNYIDRYVEGVRKYLFKQDPSTIPGSRMKLNVMYGLDKSLRGIVGVGWLYILYTLLV